MDMSKDTSSSSSSSEGNENEFDESESNPIRFPPPPPSRTPLNTIPDPSQFQKPQFLQDLDSLESKDNTITNKLEASRSSSSSHRSSDKKIEQVSDTHQLLLLNRSIGTPRVSGRHGKPHSDPNSAHTTPARRVSLASSSGACAGIRLPPPQHSGSRAGGTSSRVSRGISLVNSELSFEIPHFELLEDPSFWNDHNVQVLIRIRPLSNKEMVTQGYGRCLRQESPQTLAWLGHPETRFTFDHIACETISQEKLFKVAGLPMVDNCMSGYNSCMFAYGQTGSGKTYTMMGEIYQLEGQLNEDCGITPRIFEYLFSRIKEEEENRRDDRLEYSCKCSFLEIYNEQITDLLEPSSSNLQLREDLKKGVYVENLTEHSVTTVDDVLQLLLQGAANRKMAATYMNSESSRSHSVFTCIIESHWEKDSMTHLRFGRLNLVDLAGSERQKSSGAEGDRLKEAANINKSLSTLGLVIMSLVDLAHGKHRHVPYRDSRLTFLLQDSLGGNSKTTIIANVSPSICSANETLSTLKFAQRAKLIQNNAKINEDASGNVTALQRQIQQLQGQLSFLMKHYNISRPVSSFVPSFHQSCLGDLSEEYDSSWERNMCDDHHTPRVPKRKMKCLEAALVGAFRREKFSETAVKRLEAEIEQMNRLAQQREEDAQRAKMMLRFREEKIKRLELFADGLISTDKYLMEENSTLKEENQLLRERIDRNPELTRFALENIRLLDQLRLFQEFYEHGEREKLLVEISEFRDQLLENFEGNYDEHKFLSRTEEVNDVVKELEDCKNMNSELMREIDELRADLRKYRIHASDSVTDFSIKDAVEFKQTEKCSLVETLSISSDSGDEMASCNQPEDEVLLSSNTQKELLHTRSLIEKMESEQVRLIKELQFMHAENRRYMEILSNKDLADRESLFNIERHSKETSGLENQKQALVMGSRKDISTEALQAKLDRMTKELEEAQFLNCQYQDDQASQLSRKHQVELVCEQVEMETAKTILHLQEEVAALQSELEERLCYMAEENTGLKDTVASKEDELRTLNMEWERATLELTSFLIEGSKSLRDASSQIESIACSFPHVNICLSEHVERAVKVCVEKEETILLLQNSLEDAQKMVLEMEQKLNSLKGATVALNEMQENGASMKEEINLTMLLNSKFNMIDMLENKLAYKEDHIMEAESSSNAVFQGEKKQSDCAEVSIKNNIEGDIPHIESEHNSEIKTHGSALALEDDENQVELARLALLESENAIYRSCADTEIYISALQSDIHETSSLYREFVRGFVEDIHEMRKNFVQLNEKCRNFLFQTVEIPSLEAHNIPKHENQCFLVHQIRDELAETNDRLNTIRSSINKILYMYDYPVRAEDVEIDQLSAVCSISGSDHTAECSAPEKSSDGSSSTIFFYNCLGEITEKTADLEFEGGSIMSADDQQSEKLSGPVKSLIHDEPAILHLEKELKKATDAFIKLNYQLTALFQEKEIGDCSYTGVCFRESLDFANTNEKHIFKKGLNQHKTLETSPVLQPCELIMCEAEGGHYNIRECITNEKINQDSSFFTKFEETSATMKEADVMLIKLLKANENAKQLTGMWKQAGEELTMEKQSMANEIEQLKSLIRLKVGENEMLQDLIHYNVQDTANSISLLEESFLHMQRDVEEMFKIIYSEALKMAQEILHCFCNSRSSLEGICSETMEQGFASLVLYQCHAEEIFRKFPRLNVNPGFHQAGLQQSHVVMNNSGSKYDTWLNGVKGREEVHPSVVFKRLEKWESAPAHDNLMNENMLLKKELERKEVVLKGLLFDFSLLQESASTIKDTKDETERLIVALSQVKQELQMKTNQLNDVLVQYTKLEDRLADSETALFISNSDLEQAKGTVDILSDQIDELRVLLKDLYLRKSEVEEQLEEQREVVKSLEKEILCMNSSTEKKLQSSIENIEDDLRRVTIERDQLREQVGSLHDRLELAYSLADENEAIAVEARQESEASKVYAEQKEEEVKILEHSVQELECTINVLERKVYEMDEEVEKHELIRNSLELELQSLKRRMLTVENFTENSNVEQPHEDQLSRSMELHEAHKRIRVLEEEIAEHAKEMKQCKEYISELVLHAEAQATQYQQKYKTLEDMVREVKSDSITLPSAALTLDKTEKISMRPRGSSSPFRCIASLVQQMNLEKDQELSVAQLRIEELEALAASRHKEVCMLNARLAAAESMTHDVIRDLLGVKLDMVNYANLIDQYQLQKLVEDAQLQVQESVAMEQEILNLRRQINDLVEERERCISEVNRRQADILAAEVTVEQLQERDQLLTAQNEMLKVDNSNLKRRIVELDEMVKKLFGTQNAPLRIQQQRRNKENLLKQQGDADLSRRLAKSEKLLSRVNNELAQYRNTNGRDAQDKLDGHLVERRIRKQNA